uniref:C2H2-type domain-containing protein n=1 Tax=Otus sunia TaxID=257818 RepID=A0A8C8EC54_9STRI
MGEVHWSRDCPAPMETHRGTDVLPERLGGTHMGGRSWRTVSHGRDPKLEQERSVRHLPPEEEGAREHLGGAQVPSGLKAQHGANRQGHAGREEEKGREGAEQVESWSRWLLFMCLKSPQLSPFALPTGAGTDKQKKKKQCQPREEQRGMLQGSEEEPQSPTVDMEHDGQQQPDDTQGSHEPRTPRKRSFNGTGAEDPEEGTTQPQSHSRAKGVYKCEDCGKVFPWESNLTLHQQIHRGRDPYTCPDCGKSCRDCWKLLRHQRTHIKEKPYICTTCGKRFSSRRNLMNHDAIHTGEKLYNCSDCGTRFQQKFEFLRHLLTVHNDKRDRHTHTHSPCVSTHLPTSSRETQYKCEYCGKVFNSGSNLTCHLRIHTRERPFTCQDCGKSFIESGSLVRHRRAHTKEKPFLCTTCGKVFTCRSKLKNKLKQHQRIHTGEKPYKCQDCGRSFRESGTLRRHQRTHKKEKTIPCTICGKHFSFRWKLLRHQRTHTKEKPFPCTFSLNSIRRLHTHTGERPYTFSDCRKSFRQRCHLWRHHSVIHNGESSGGVLWHNPASGHAQH